MRAHPEIDVLAGYSQGRLDESAAEAVQEHLLECSRCTALLLAQERFADAGAGTETPREPAAARLMARSVLQQVRAARWRNLALAASLLLAISLPLGIYRGTRPAAPEVNQPIVSLSPRSALRGGEATRLTLAPGTRFFTLVLNSGDVPAASEHRLVVLDRTGREVLALDGLLPTPVGTFNVGLPASTLSPGSYRLLLLAAAGERREPVAEYALEILSP